MNSGGFTLVEWLIAMVLGLFLLGAVLGIQLLSRATTAAVFEQSELQENGGLAMRLLIQDLRWAGSWGNYTGMPMQVDSGLTLSAGALIAPAIDCMDDRGEGSLPSAASVTRALWVARVDERRHSKGFDCIPLASRIAGSEVISIKRLSGPPQRGALDRNRFYLATTIQAAYLFRGDEPAPTDQMMPGRQIWEYQHHIYYLALGGSGIPELRKRILTVNGGASLISGPMAEGIEKVVILLGVDTSTSTDGQIDKYVASVNVSDQEWDQGRVLAARVAVLVRSRQASRQYVNNNVYQVGNISLSGNGDGFRRLLLESSVALRNPALVAGRGP